LRIKNITTFILKLFEKSTRLKKLSLQHIKQFMNNTWKSHLALFLANFLYGINYVVAKGVMPVYITPVALTFLRIMPATILFWIAGLMVKHNKIEPKDYLNLFLAGIFGVFLNQFMFIKGLSLSGPINAAIIMTTNPIIVLLVSAFVLREKLSKLKLIGIFVGAVGALILVVGKGFSGFSQQSIAGDLLLLGNSISFAVYMIFAKPLMRKYDAFFVLKWIFLFGAILYFPFGINEFILVKWNVMPPHILFSLVYVVLGTTFLTYLLINYALKRLKPTTVSIYVYIQPVIACITAIAIGVDALTVLNILASLLVFSGVFLVSKVNSKKA